MQDSGIPVERKNSAASAASSSRKGSNDNGIGDEKEKCFEAEHTVGKKEGKSQLLRVYNGITERDAGGDVGRWREDIGQNIRQQEAQWGVMSTMDTRKEDGKKEPTPSEIGVAL